MRNVAVVGVGETAFGEHWEKSLRALAVEAGIAAIRDANIEGADIEAMYIGNMSAGKFIGQEHLAALAVDQAGLVGIPSSRLEAACASGSLAFRQACLAVASGEYDIVIAAGAEKMTDLQTEDVTTTLMGAGDQEWEGWLGMTFPGLYALMARRHMYEYNTTREQMALFSVNGHKNAALNPKAQFPFEITVEDVLNSPPVADPLRLLDCSPVSDGAAAVIIASEDAAKRFENPIWLIGSGQATDNLALHDRKSLTSLRATKIAAKKAYEQAGISPEKIDVAEVHDCFSINGLIALEDLGFCERGKSGKFVEDGNIERGAAVSINTSGGLKAKGHPVGATGISQIIEIVKQLRGECGKRQVPAEFGLTHNVGGTGATVVVNIFGKELKERWV